jgi:hypothetical protein
VKRLSAPKERQRGRVRLSGIAAAMKGRVRGRPAPAGGGGGDTFGMTLNLAGMQYFADYTPFIDRIKHTSVQWTSDDFPGGMPRNDARLNSDHFPSNLAAGQQCTLIVWLELSRLRSTNKAKPGNYKVTWTPTGAGGCAVSVSGTGLSSVVNGSAGVSTFTLADGALADGLFVTVTNGGGAAAGATNIKLFHTDHEADLGTGEMFDPDFIASLLRYTNLRYVRFLDFQAANVGALVSPSDLLPLSYQSYARGDKGVPPEVIGALIKRLGNGVRPWTVMPYAATDAFMTAFFTRMKDGDPTGTWKAKIGGVNEPWNFGFPGYGWLVNTGSIGLSWVNSDGGVAGSGPEDEQFRMYSAWAHHAMRTWTAAEAVFGASRVIRLGTMQTDYSTSNSPHNASLFYRDTTNTLYGGATFVSLLNATGPGGHTGEIELSGYFYSYASTSQKTKLRENVGGFTNAALRDLYIADLTSRRDGAQILNCNSMRTRGFTATFTVYEAGCHDFYDRNNTGATFPASFAGTVNTGTNTIDFPVETTDWVDNGDRIRAPNQVPANGQSFPYDLWVRKTGTNALRCYSSLAAYTADSGNTGAGATSLLAGSFLFCPQDRLERLSDKMFTFFNSAEGVAVWTFLVNSVFKHASINTNQANLFVHNGAMQGKDWRFTDCFGAHGTAFNEPESATTDYLQSVT